MAIAAAAAVEAVEVGDGQVLERNGGQRRKAGQGWKCMPFIIGTYELVIAKICFPSLQPSPNLLLVPRFCRSDKLVPQPDVEERGRSTSGSATELARRLARSSVGFTDFASLDTFPVSPRRCECLVNFFHET
jgi:hypothetical protein